MSIWPCRCNSDPEMVKKLRAIKQATKEWREAERLAEFTIRMFKRCPNDETLHEVQVTRANATEAWRRMSALERETGIRA